ncbi:hypothetical protein OG711_03790 [Streptomyces uncialis]|uniref:hypothetical protein n=1 Tax=Streptomyces uncialis TaxID=1048205 RepID=UPI002E340984|nr:hypothetical protein [Streptomyces uncialis]
MSTVSSCGRGPDHRRWEQGIRSPERLCCVCVCEFDLPALEALAFQDAATRPALPACSRTHTLRGGVEVTVLADGRPVNFHETDSISNLHSDFVYAGMLTGACAVATDPAPAGLDPSWADTVLEGSGLLQDYYERYGPPAAPTGTAPSSARGRPGRGNGERS